MPFYLNRLVQYIVVLLFLVTACSQTSEKVPVSVRAAQLPTITTEELKREVEKIGEEELLKNGAWAFSLRSAKTGKPLVEHRANKSMVIASNMKVITTATALAMLGEDFTFKTELQYDGSLGADGILDGNLYIKGGGDPTLGSDQIKGSLSTAELMAVWAEQISQAGIKQVKGSVVGDGDVYNDNAVPIGWTWSDIGNYYGAPALGLNINDNEYKLYFKPGNKSGASTRILRIEPQIKDITFVNEVLTGPPGSGDNAYIYGAPYTDLRYVQGTVPAGPNEFMIRGAIPDPAQLTAQLLQKRLEQKGIQVDAGATTTRLLRQQNKLKANERTTVYTHLSPSLKEIITQTNVESMNLYAEALLKMIGVEVFKEGTTYSGAKAVTEFWQKNGIDVSALFMRDGSGLSRSNAASADVLTAILTWMAQQPYFTTFYSSLPVAGVSGTLASLGKGTPIAGKISAKSGSIERVLSYSGYFYTQSGELLSFAMIANDFGDKGSVMRKRMEKLMLKMVQLR